MELSYRHLMLSNFTVFQKKVYEKLAEPDFSIGQPKIFDFLFYNDGCMQKEIGYGCQIEPASVTSILATMEKNGYIRRESQEGNRRSLFVFLTEKGKKTAEKVNRVMLELEDEALSSLSLEERKVFLSFLKKVNSNLVK